MDFTLKKYEQLILAIKNKKYTTQTIKEYIITPNKNHTIVLRHDVDRMPKNALKMAELEHRHNIQSTYYFRIPYTFNRKIITQIAEFGHEVGYHYETLSSTNGDIEKAYALFEKNLIELRAITPVDTVCMHGSPLSKHDNRDLWRAYKLSEFGLIGEPYLSIDYSKIEYFTDTGRCWDGSKGANLRDRVDNDQTQTQKCITTTSDLINYIKSQSSSLVIQTHPERWAYSHISLFQSIILDLSANLAKKVIKKIYRT